METPHYKAFISYSHQDEAWARWLQKSLESYRVPKRLIGVEGPHGPIPGRLQPIFRDREDLSSASDLTARIRQELAASETLIVICSPAAAQSRWVNAEIRHFRELGRGDRILALVVDGDPAARDPALASFPEALLRHAGDSVPEPLAADARRYADGKRLARLKLVAGILGIRLDELRRRDAQRRARRRLAWTALILATSAIVGWLAWATAITQQAARTQRANTQELLSFMLGDLKRLDPIVGLEIVDAGDPVLEGFRETLGFDRLSDDALINAARDWREQGIGHHGRGALAPAMERFQQSRAAFVELHQREGSTRRALFELGQAEFWVGYVHLDGGELDEAQNSFARYGAITRRLINAEPNNATFVMELAYSLTNLGVVERARQHPDTGRALQLFQSAIQYNQMALVLDPDNDIYRNDLAMTLAHLADAWLDDCDLGNAFSLRTQNVALTRELHQRAPGDPRRQEVLAFALSGLATVQQQMGLAELAEANLAESGRLLRELLAIDPDNGFLYWEALLREQRLVRLMVAQDRDGEAWTLAQPLMERIEGFFQRTSSGGFLMAVEASQFRVDYARIALRQGLSTEGRRALERAVSDLQDLVRANAGHRHSRHQLARASFEHWREFGHLPERAAGELLEDYRERGDVAGSCADASLAARLAVMQGDRGLARRYTRYVLGKGYFEPDFVSFCRAYGLCDLEPGERSPPVAGTDAGGAVGPQPPSSTEQ